MKFEYSEFANDKDYDQCIELQRKLFGLSDKDLISPLFLKLIARNSPPVGISLGLFVHRDNGTRELIGFIIGFASFWERSIHAVLMGITDEFQNQGFGKALYLEFRKISIEKNIRYMYGIFDPIESQLAYVYFLKLGFQGIKYETEAYKLSNADLNNYIPIDKLLIKWDFVSQNVVDKVNFDYEYNFEEIIQSTPIVSVDKFVDNHQVLLEIPYSFKDLKNEDFSKAFEWRLNTRKLFNEYVNNRGFIVKECISQKTHNTRRTFYLLEKPVK